eukprot:1655702-Prorocentrum_lima.AAC.1
MPVPAPLLPAPVVRRRGLAQQNSTVLGTMSDQRGPAGPRVRLTPARTQQWTADLGSLTTAP